MDMKLKKLAISVGILGVTGTAAWASCGGTEGMVSSAAGSLASLITTELAASTTKLIAADYLQTQSIMSSLHILAKQVEASGEKLSSTTIGVEQSTVALAKENAEKEMVAKLVVDYASQGFDPCGQSAATQNLAKTEAEVNAKIPGLVRSEIEGGGGKFGSPHEALRAREDRHKALFCTQSEVDAGACTRLGKIPGGDSNAALLFSVDSSTEARAAKNALINQVVGLPDSPVRPEAANSPAAAAYLLEKKQKDAFMAFPAYSLKTIQAENENLKAVMDNRVGQYFGTARAAEWARSQTSQAPRGLLVDLVKMQGINLKLAERRLHQNMRIEANLALLLELENRAETGAHTAQLARQVGVATDATRQKVSN